MRKWTSGLIGLSFLFVTCAALPVAFSADHAQPQHSQHQNKKSKNKSKKAHHNKGKSHAKAHKTSSKDNLPSVVVAPKK